MTSKEVATHFSAVNSTPPTICQPPGPCRALRLMVGHAVVEESEDCPLTDGGFRSEHFSEARLRTLVGDCTIRRLAGIAYVVTF